MLVDTIAGCSMLSFIDGFSGINQIKIDFSDAEKIALQLSIQSHAFWS